MSVSLKEGVAYVPVRANGEGVACVTVSPIEKYVANVPFSSNEGPTVPFPRKTCHDEILAQ